MKKVTVEFSAICPSQVANTRALNMGTDQKNFMNLPAPNVDDECADKDD